MFVHKSIHADKRDGIAASEFAIIMPILFLIIAGTIEITSAFFLKESLTIAAFEGARVAVQRRATTDEVEDRILGVLQERNVALGSGIANVVVSPDPRTSAIMTPIQVTVTAPTAGNTVIPMGGLFSWFGAGVISADVVMVKEFTDN